jgi:hypothetical protein
MEVRPLSIQLHPGLHRTFNEEAPLFIKALAILSNCAYDELPNM